jgi:ABC-type nitrate/sulfonate/bicarbonate transport system permease component
MIRRPGGIPRQPGTPRHEAAGGQGAAGRPAVTTSHFASAPTPTEYDDLYSTEYATRQAWRPGRGLLVFALRLVVIAAAVGAWQLATNAANSPFYLPPSAIVPAMYHQWFSGPASHFWLTPDATANLLPSVGRMLAGWAIAAVAGIALGVAIGRLPLLADLTEPVVHFARAVPPPALVPVFLFVFNIGTPMELASIIFGVIWPVLINSIDGARHVHPGHLETARAFRIPPVTRLVRIILPSAAPKILAGLRLSLALALVMMIISEFVGSTNGIGREMLQDQSLFNVSGMWGVIVLLGLLGLLLNAAFSLIEHRVLAWRLSLRCEVYRIWVG